MQTTRSLGLLALALALTLAVALAPPASAEEGTWTGEVVDVACYVAKGAHGPDHADCAKACVKGGQPMGLLTADGGLYMLAADHQDGAPYEALKELAGSQAEVTGSMSERDGVAMITVTGAEAAS